MSQTEILTRFTFKNHWKAVGGHWGVWVKWCGNMQTFHGSNLPVDSVCDVVDWIQFVDGSSLCPGRRSGEDGRDEPRRGVRSVGLRASGRRRARLQRGRLHDGAEAGGRGGDGVVVGQMWGQRGLHPPQPAGGELTVCLLTALRRTDDVRQECLVADVKDQMLTGRCDSG